MQLSQDPSIEFITSRHHDVHGLSDGTQWLPLPPTDLKFETCRSLWEFPGPLNIQRVKEALKSTLSLYPHFAGRLALVPLETDLNSAETGPLQWRINLIGTEGVQFSSTATQHPGVFRAEYKYDDLHPGELLRRVGSTGPRLKRNPSIPSHERSGHTSISMTSSHVLGDAFTLMSFFETWSIHYQNEIPSWKPTYDHYLSHKPFSNVAATGRCGTSMLPMEYVSAAVPYIGFLAIDYPLTYMLEKTERMNDSSMRIDLKFPRETLQKIYDWTLLTNPGKDNTASSNLSVSDALSAYLVYTLQKISETRILQVQQIVGGYEGASQRWSSILPPTLTSSGNCFIIVSSKNRLEGSESPREVACMFRDTLTELRQPETFQKTYAVYSWLYERIAEGSRFPMEIPTEAAVQVNNLSKFPALKGHFGYPGHVRMYRWDSYQNFFEIIPANPILTTSGEWIQFDGGVDVYVRIKQHLAGEFVRVLQADMRINGLGELMSAVGPINLKHSKL